jgi:hypothetical protein
VIKSRWDFRTGDNPERIDSLPGTSHAGRSQLPPSGWSKTEQTMALYYIGKIEATTSANGKKSV